VSTSAEYIYYSGEITLDSNNMYVPSLVYNPKTIGLTSYPAYFILLNTLIPISLVVTLEIVKTL
jgi:magnesium-transporting ATPase (P-type)